MDELIMEETKVEALQLFIEKCRLTLTEDQVKTGDACRTYQASTTGKKVLISGALLPVNTKQVQQIVKFANQYNIKLYPLSTGHNWGYGSAQPVIDNNVILDLSKMNKILSFDSELGIVTLEPGVTHGQLAEYLKEQGDAFMVPIVGAGPNCSLVGNALERGFGANPHADHFSAVNDMEVVLPSGELYRSIFKDLDCSKVSDIYKWGVGPYVDGLFTQGNFGVVTQMTVVLIKHPEALTFFILGADTAGELAEALRETRQALGNHLSTVYLMDRYRGLATLGAYDHSQKEGDIRSKKVLEKLAKKHHLSNWTAVGALYSPKVSMRKYKKFFKSKTRHIKSRRLLFIDDFRLNFLKCLAKCLPGVLHRPINERLNKLEGAMDLFRGKPGELSLKLAYWKSTHKPSSKVPLNPARDGCGLLWFAPLIPAKKEVVDMITKLIHNICLEHHIEPLISLALISEYHIDCTISLLFKLEKKEEVEKGHACYLALFEACRKKGFLPYRMPTHAMHLVVKEDSTYWKTAAKLKRALDPNNIISPKRYSLL